MSSFIVNLVVFILGGALALIFVRNFMWLISPKMEARWKWYKKEWNKAAMSVYQVAFMLKKDLDNVIRECPQCKHQFKGKEGRLMPDALEQSLEGLHTVLEGVVEAPEHLEKVEGGSYEI